MENKKPKNLILLLFLAVAIVSALLSSLVTYFLPKNNYYEPNDDDMLAFQIQNLRDNVFEIRSEDRVGTGFIVRAFEDYAIAVSCYHVTKADDAFLSIKTRGSDTFKNNAEIIAVDENYDISVLKLNGKYNAVDLMHKSTTATIGAKIALLGNNLGQGITAFDGIIGGDSKAIKCEDANNANIHLRYLPAIHITASVNAGSSGCPVFDQNGNLLGVGFYQVFGSSDRPVYDTSFMLPFSVVKEVVLYALDNMDSSFVSVDRVPVKLDEILVSDGDEVISSTTAEIVGCGFKVQFGDKITVLDGVHAGKEVVSFDGKQVKSVADFCSSLVKYSTNDATAKLVVRFSDGSSAEIEVNKTVE